jgi:hypothetical protein
MQLPEDAPGANASAGGSVPPVFAGCSATGSECPAWPQPKAAADTVGSSGARHTLRGLVGALLSRATGERAVERTSTQSATPGGLSSSPGGSPPSDPRNATPEERQIIELQHLAKSARPFQTVRIEGMYHGGAETFCGCSAGRAASGWTSRYPLRRTSRAVHRSC